jgi:hypothetical protein
MAIYFTSEAEARLGEKKDPPPELADKIAEMDTLDVDEVTFFDLRDPWLSSSLARGQDSGGDGGL